MLTISFTTIQYYRQLQNYRQYANIESEKQIRSLIGHSIFYFEYNAVIFDMRSK